MIHTEGESMTHHTLYNWSVSYTSDPRFRYMAPEVKPVIVMGNLDAPNGSLMEVNPVSADGRVLMAPEHVITATGEPEAGWVAWMADHGIPFDPEHPFKRWETT